MTIEIANYYIYVNLFSYVFLINQVNVVIFLVNWKTDWMVG